MRGLVVIVLIAIKLASSIYSLNCNHYCLFVHIHIKCCRKDANFAHTGHVVVLARNCCLANRAFLMLLIVDWYISMASSSLSSQSIQLSSSLPLPVVVEDVEAVVVVVVVVVEEEEEVSQILPVWRDSCASSSYLDRCVTDLICGSRRRRIRVVSRRDVS